MVLPKDWTVNREIMLLCYKHYYAVSEINKSSALGLSGSRTGSRKVYRAFLHFIFAHIACWCRAEKAFDWLTLMYVVCVDLNRCFYYYDRACRLQLGFGGIIVWHCINIKRNKAFWIHNSLKLCAHSAWIRSLLLNSFAPFILMHNY